MKGPLKLIAGTAPHPAVARIYELVFQIIAFVGFAWAAGGLYMTLQFGERAYGGVGPWVAFSVLFGAAWLALFSHMAEYASQRGRDLKAKRIFALLRKGVRPEPFALYLRPFASTNAVQEDVIAPMSFAVGGGLFLAGSTRFELEQQIERATRSLGPLVALGEPLEHVGAGRIRVEEDTWRGAVEVLTGSADLIVLLPSSRAGTLWEVERILSSDLISRTVFVDPPNRVRKDSTYAQGAEWAQVRDAFLKRGYEMPEDSMTGQLLYFGQSKKPIARARLDIDAEDNIARFFKKVLKLQAREARRGNGGGKRS
jgi:hypothetical protein